MMNLETVDILHVSDKLAAERLRQTLGPIISSFLICCCYFTCLKAHEISWQNMRNLENII